MDFLGASAFGGTEEGRAEWAEWARRCNLTFFFASLSADVDVDVVGVENLFLSLTTPTNLHQNIINRSVGPRLGHPGLGLDGMLVRR